MISWFEKHSKISLLITIIIAVAIFYVSSLTFPSGKPGSNIKSILYHLFIFFLFSLFLLISLTKRKNVKLIPIAITTAVLYGILDELHQLFVPGRACSLGDVFVDAVGITFAFMLYSIRILTLKE